MNGGDGFNGDMWNSFETTIAGFSAGEIAPSVRALVLLLTAIALALGLILLGVMWVYYSRSPETLQHLQLLELPQTMANYNRSQRGWYHVFLVWFLFSS